MESVRQYGSGLPLLPEALEPVEDAPVAVAPVVGESVAVAGVEGQAVGLAERLELVGDGERVVARAGPPVGGAMEDEHGGVDLLRPVDDRAGAQQLRAVLCEAGDQLPVDAEHFGAALAAGGEVGLAADHGGGV